MNATTTPARACGDCAMCCKLPEIKALNKPANTWCSHCSTRQSCDNYDARPDTCRDFNCGFITQPGFGEEWRPTTAKMMIVLKGGHAFFIVDPSRPDAWKRAPYYQQLKHLARTNNPRGQQIIVNVNGHHIVIAPDKDTDIGIVRDDETVTFSIEQTPQGPVTHVSKTTK